MNVREYLKTIPAEEESIKQEASIYRGMKFAERLKCFKQIMELVEHLCPLPPLLDLTKEIISALNSRNVLYVGARGSSPLTCNRISDINQGGVL